MCTSCNADSLTIDRDGHGPVTIRLLDVVTGKPVPPRASVRDRVGARDAELHSLVMWPSVEREAIGDWVLRSDPAPAPRLITRANSCLAFGHPGMPVAAAAEQILAFYSERSRPALVQLELGGPFEGELRELGWTPVAGGDAHFMLTSIAQSRRLVPSDDLAVDLVEEGPRVRAVRRVDGRQAGSVRAALSDDWLGIHGLDVSGEHRGRGHATALMGAVLEWGAEKGARTAWLHVETENQPAIGRYERWGFRSHHTNRYLAL